MFPIVFVTEANTDHWRTTDTSTSDAAKLKAYWFSPSFEAKSNEKGSLYPIHIKMHFENPLSYIMKELLLTDALFLQQSNLGKSFFLAKEDLIVRTKHVNKLQVFSRF